MKLKDWLLWLCLVGFIVTEILLFSANRQKSAVLVQLREAQTQVTQLQGQVDQLKSSSVAVLNAENSRLRAENQNCSQKNAQLQTENGRLQGVNQQLTQQLENAHATTQQQQQQLQEMQTESQQANSAPDASGDAAAAANACINNLRQIDAAKQQWALENNRSANAVPTAQDLLPYFPSGLFPVCPSGGTYTINAVGVLPTCSFPGHVLSQ